MVGNKADLVRQHGVSDKEYEEVHDVHCSLEMGCEYNTVSQGLRQHCDVYLKDFGRVPIVVTDAVRRMGIDG